MIRAAPKLNVTFRYSKSDGLRSLTAMLARRFVFMVFAVAMLFGCAAEPPAAPYPSSSRSADAENAKESPRDVAAAKRETPGTESPVPVIELPSVEGWIRSEFRPLPPADHGFTVAYDHPVGMSVTLYQFTRGLTAIPDKLRSDEVRAEMKSAKAGIEQAVQMGKWQSAAETANGVVKLGESSQEAEWSRFKLTFDGRAVRSDTYIWVHANTFLKLRCTAQPQSPEPESDKALSLLLSAIGNACQPRKE